MAIIDWLIDKNVIFNKIPFAQHYLFLYWSWNSNGKFYILKLGWRMI